MPTMHQAGVYSSVLHYLKAVQAAGTDDAKTVVARMRETPVNDMFATNGKIREDGRMVHDMYLMQVKTPKESTGEVGPLQAHRHGAGATRRSGRSPRAAARW